MLVRRLFKGLCAGYLKSKGLGLAFQVLHFHSLAMHLSGVPDKFRVNLTSGFKEIHIGESIA